MLIHLVGFRQTGVPAGEERNDGERRCSKIWSQHFQIRVSIGMKDMSLGQAVHNTGLMPTKT